MLKLHYLAVRDTALAISWTKSMFTSHSKWTLISKYCGSLGIPMEKVYDIKILFLKYGAFYIKVKYTYMLRFNDMLDAEEGYPKNYC